MSKRQPQKQPAKSPSRTGNVILDARQEKFAHDDQEDKKTLRIALTVAILAHLVLLVVQFPELSRADQKPPEEERKVYVVQQVRLKPPPPPKEEPPPPEKPKPKKKAKKIPVPDPEPDIDPIRPPEPVEPQIDLETPEIEFEIPEAPPLPEPEPEVIPEAPPPPEPEGPIHVGGDVKAPVKVTAPPPQYTPTARAARIQGMVVVQAIIDKQGNVTDVKVLKGLPMGLDLAAEEAVKKWKFKPATLNGKPVEVYFNLTVNFTLQ